MKSIIFLFFQIFLLNAFSQEKPLIFTEIVKVDSSISKNILYERARAWLNDKFKNYKEVSQIQDKESGELSVKGILYTHYLKNVFGESLSNFPCYVRFKLTIWVKDGRYKYEFSDFNDECIGQGSYSSLGILTDRETFKEKGNGKRILNELWIEVKQETNLQTKEMIDSLRTEMSKELKKDDW